MKKLNCKCLAIMAILAVVICSCKDKTGQSSDISPTAEGLQGEPFDDIKIEFGQALQIDSSSFVIYPLSNDKYEEEESGLGGSSSGYGNSGFWNLIFYNTATGDYHLLSENRKMIISSFDRNEILPSLSNSSSEPEQYDSGLSILDSFLFYSITVLDYNADGKLNTDDPQYLFISDKEGKNLRQISPDHVHVMSWQSIRGTNKILLNTLKDSQPDQQFNNTDEEVVMLIDLETETIARPIFSTEFNLRMKEELAEQWVRAQK